MILVLCSSQNLEGNIDYYYECHMFRLETRLKLDN